MLGPAAAFDQDQSAGEADKCGVAFCGLSSASWHVVPIIVHGGEKIPAIAIGRVQAILSPR
jgi:hypothetical protein